MICPYCTLPMSVSIVSICSQYDHYCSYSDSEFYLSIIDYNDTNYYAIGFSEGKYYFRNGRSDNHLINDLPKFEFKDAFIYLKKYKKLMVFV